MSARLEQINRDLALNRRAEDMVEAEFKVAVGGLSDRRRIAAFAYVRLLRDRVQLLEARHVREIEELLEGRIP